MTQPTRLSMLSVSALALGLVACCPGLAFAQQQQTSSQPASQSGSYEGVAHPPADDTIETSPDTQPAVAPAPKPSPAVAATTPGMQANPDDGIVSSVPPPSYGAPRMETHLVARPENPDDGIVGMVPSPSNQLAEGTNIRVRLLQALSTTTSQDGEAFRAQVSADVYKEGRVVIPMGSELRGRVVSVSQGHRFGPSATLRLRPDAIMLPDGSSYHLYAEAVGTDANHVRTGSEGGLQPSSRLTKDMVQYGAVAGGGAATGALLGGPVGAAAGAIVGAGLVTTHLLLQHPQQAQVAQGDEVTFSLTEPMDLVPTRN